MLCSFPGATGLAVATPVSVRQQVVGGSPAAIAFEEATVEAGIAYTGMTWGVSWGDVNGDGLPDAWVSNHVSAPSLYLNLGQGRFRDVVAERWSGLVGADSHGAAWADYDNDGDQDLLQLTGGQVGTSASDDPHFMSYLYRNDGGRLRAVEAGLSHRLGRGRTPLWVDYDGDGWLDVVVAGLPRPDGQRPSTLYRQVDGKFVDAGEASGFRSPEWLPRVVRWLGLEDTALWKRFASRMRYESVAFTEYAQLADLSGRGRPEMVVHGTPYPYRAFRAENGQLHDLTGDFPRIDGVQDSVIADFDGDLRPDVFAVRAAGPYTPEVLRSDARTLRAFMRGDARRFTFQADGMAEFQMARNDREAAPESIPPEAIHLGSQGIHPDALPLRLEPSDPRVQGVRAPDAPGVHIGFDLKTRRWTVAFVPKEPSHNLTVTVRAERGIRAARTTGFGPAEPFRAPVLLLNTAQGFVDRTEPAGLAHPVSCLSAVAGDFDNDMDQDIYLVCSRTTANLPNQLYENLGQGRFRLVAGAGGAAGSMQGRGESVATADYDMDGFLDLFVTNGQWVAYTNDGPHQLFRNRGNGNRWIEIDLVGSRVNRDAIGAIVTVSAGGVKQRRVQDGGMHRYAQNHQRLHFGLASNARVDEIEVRWPDGQRQVLRNVPANRLMRIEQRALGETRH